MAYVQNLAAHEAGFRVDVTGNSEYAGSGRRIKNANRAMLKLIALSRHFKAGAAPLTAHELHAKAIVLAGMYGLCNDERLDPIEMAYVRMFAGEVSDFLAANHKVPE